MRDNLADITDPVARAKLAGIQESVFATDAEMDVVKKAIDQKIGAASALDQIGKRVFELCIPIQEKVKAEEVEAAEAKLTINGIKLAVKLCQQYEAEIRKDIVEMRGQVNGMERAVVRMGEKFKLEAEKFERYERMEAEGNDRDELEGDDTELDEGNGNGVAVSD